VVLHVIRRKLHASALSVRSFSTRQLGARNFTLASRYNRISPLHKLCKSGQLSAQSIASDGQFARQVVLVAVYLYLVSMQLVNFLPTVGLQCERYSLGVVQKALVPSS
jgi:hypothetical protein